MFDFLRGLLSSDPKTFVDIQVDVPVRLDSLTTKPRNSVPKSTRVWDETKPQDIKKLLSLVICTPAPSTNVSALGFSTNTVICGMGKPSRHVLAIKAARASNVWNSDGSTI